MPFAAQVYRIMIASPGDVEEERDVIREAVHRWNSLHSSSQGLILLPVGWDTDTAPAIGDGL